MSTNNIITEVSNLLTDKNANIYDFTGMSRFVVKHYPEEEEFMMFSQMTHYLIPEATL
jgi:hypothetical protein